MPVRGPPKAGQELGVQGNGQLCARQDDSPGASTTYRDQMQSRWRTYIKKFWGTLYDSIHRAGLGLTKRDVANGKTSIEQKLEARCPEFLRIKVLFSEMSNIKPAGTVDLVSPLGPLS
ncbi:hypothetical protein F444_07629 [Phytophthora nicotianae P1976]|uniref:Uncharacterized protein n=1 Tax=Phytophthora nicotianae P1976 TaxID=1317066 RepID=A0A081AE35_PHYNI|nr:hypothetical protein F444_07629 [Phytophthora nicotianae P1976]